MRHAFGGPGFSEPGEGSEVGYVVLWVVSAVVLLFAVLIAVATWMRELRVRVTRSSKRSSAGPWTLGEVEADDDVLVVERGTDVRREV